MIPFWKVESVGNDFVLVHLDDVLARAGADTEAYLHQLAVQASSRHFGIGSDGLLVVSKEGAGELMMRMFNPDGSEDFCGNGLRCAFAHAVRRGWIAPGPATIEHLSRTVHGTVETREDGDYEVGFLLPPASYAPQDVPIAREHEAFDTELFHLGGKTFSGSILTTGSAHTIIPVDRLPEDDEFFAISPEMENHTMFPERTSIMWVETVGPHELKLRIWERGAGETLGCGTGSTATAVDYLRRCDCGGTVTVHNPGGTLTVSAENWQSAMQVRGTAREVFTGDFLLGPPQ